jgi:hypothetical protein
MSTLPRPPTAPESRRPGARVRAARLVGLALAVALVGAGLLILPEVVPLLTPQTVRRHPVEWAAVAILVTYATARVMATGRAPSPHAPERARRVVERFEAVADRGLRSGLARVLGVVVVALFAFWLPNYLTLPWCRDADTFATIALDWESGIRPYRDILGYNFPGSIYLFWILGKTAGWGQTVPLFAFDAACLALLGLALVAWSRRRLGGPLPGLAGYFAFLGYYLGLTYELVAQRDWYTILGVCLALLLAQAYPGRRGRLASAAATAMAFAFRPHAVLFVPALAAAVASEASPPGEPASLRARALAVGEWALALVAATALAFAPVIAAGLLDDLVRGVRIASYGGPYSRTTPAGALAMFVEQLRKPEIDLALAATLGLALMGPPSLRRLIRPWALAWLGALVYRPLHPVSQHAYLAHPLALVASISVAFLVWWIAAIPRLPRPVRLVAIALLLYEAVPRLPDTCGPGDSLVALGALAHGREPDFPPLGCRQPYPAPKVKWADYLAAMHYLRETTGPGTPVANAVSRYPFESLNGPIGRPSPFLAESGVCWMMFVNMNLDAQFARALERSPDAVVVWTPRTRTADPRLKLDRVAAVIRRDFRPEARFGELEVWRRRADRAVR